jgi:RND family efflux transporter MFP subunit
MMEQAISLATVVALITVTATGAAADEQRFDCVMDPAGIISIGGPVIGILQDVSVDRGDEVVQGQVIARLQSGVEAANVALDRLKASNTAEIELRDYQLQLSQRKLERTQTLYNKQVASEEKFDEARAEADINARALALAKLAHDTARLELERSEQLLQLREIRSPVNGIVIERKMRSGENVHPESVVMKIAELNPLFVEVFLPVRLYPLVYSGMIASVEPAAPITGRFDAKVTVIDHVFDVASATFGVRLTLPNPDNKLPGGHRCQVVFLFPPS